MHPLCSRVFAPLAIGCLAAPAFAAPFTPSQAQLADLVTGFDGAVTANTPSGDGVELTVDVADNATFSRAVAQIEGFNSDLSAFDAAEVDVLLDAGVTGITSATFFIQTGPTFSFEESASVALAPGVSSTVRLAFAAVTGDLTDVRQIGLQFFGPGGASTGQTVTLTPTVVPEPAGLAALGALGGAALLRRRARA